MKGKTWLNIMMALSIVVIFFISGCLNGTQGEESPLKAQTQWFSFEPMQCKEYPWEKDFGVVWAVMPTKEGRVISYLQTVRNIEVLEAKTYKPEGMTQCLACGECSQGYTIYIKVKNDYAITLTLQQEGWKQSDAPPQGVE